MTYLTVDDYQSLGFSMLTADDLIKLEPYASRHIDSITMDFYQKQLLSDDTNLYRAKKFKSAVALQCEYLHQAEGVSLQEVMSDTPSSVSIGRMRLELQSTSASTVASTMVCVEAYRMLAPTGLLYRGVGYV